MDSKDRSALLQLNAYLSALSLLDKRLEKAFNEVRDFSTELMKGTP